MKTSRSAIALAILAAPFAHAANVQSSYWYKSTVTSDANGPLDLLAELNYDNSRTNAPIVVVMHEYSASTGNLASMRPHAQRLRDHGFFAITVTMRGRDGSDGVRDSGGVEIHDIRDAVEAIKADPAFAARLDPGNIHITGYSGGGGNTMSALTKFPDYFRAAGAFFGMSDYGYRPVDSWYYNGAGGRTAQLNIDIGNPNTGGNAVRDRYLARASNLASKNNPYSEIHLFVNASETICPPWNDISYRDNAIAAASHSGEFDNIHVHIGGPGNYQDFNGNSVNDANELQNWPHGTLNANQQDAGELWYRDRVLAGTIPQPVLNASDVLFVAGYVKTSAFGLWLGDGQNSAGHLTYSLANGSMSFSLGIASSNTAVTGRLSVDTTSLAGRQVEVTLNGTPAGSFTGGRVYVHPDLRHDDTLELTDGGPSTNIPPTLTSFVGKVDTTPPGTTVEIAFDELAATGDETDSDGSVVAFVVRAVTNGTLKLGATSASATPFLAGSNDTINATTRAYWTPPAGTANSDLDAFGVVARDNNGADSSLPVQVKIGVTTTSTVQPGAALRVDFNDNDNGPMLTQAGFTAVTQDGGTFASNVGTGENVAIAISSDGTIDDRDRGALVGGAGLSLSDLLRDFIFSSQTNATYLDITLSTLKAGTYTFTGFFHDNTVVHDPFDLSVNTGSGFVRMIDEGTSSTGTSPTPAGKASFTFTADGTNPVSIRIHDLDGPADGSAVIGGFILVANTPGPVSWYDFEDHTLDSSGNGRHGTNRNVGFSTDIPSTLSHSTRSGSFNGTSSLVDLDYLGLFDKAHAGGLTISMWVKSSQQTAQTWVVGEGSDSSNNPAYVMGQVPAGATKFSHFLRNNTGTNISHTGALNAFDIGQWHHIAFTDIAGDVNLYIDGVLDSNSQTFDYSPTGTYTFQNSSIGAWFRGGTAMYFFSGLMDDVAIYDRVLGNSEIAALAAGAPPVPVSNNLANWIAGYDVNGMTGLSDDPDNDGIDNGVENFFGTDPSSFSPGLVAGTANSSAGVFTFIHPVNATPAKDLNAIYRWSKNLTDFHPGGDTDADGTRVDFSVQPETPAHGFVTVTAGLAGTPADKLFVDVQVSKP